MFRIYTALILVVILTFESASNDEIRSRCSSGFRSYAHCITKRENYEWCTAQGCNICTDSSCHLTCKGFSCGACPTGSCCDGKNCNGCYNNKCCSTSACNFGLNVCRQACSSNSTCLDTCVQQCYNSTYDIFVIPSQKQIVNGSLEVFVYVNGTAYKAHVSSGEIDAKNKTAAVMVNGKKRNATLLSLFPLPNLCDSGSCNQMVCSNLSDESCNNEYFHNCTSNCNVREYRQEPTWKNNTIVHTYNSTAIGRFNITTVINITNTINNTNNIENPVFANNTDHNNITLPKLQINGSQNIIHHTHQNHHNYLPQGCCHILHPPHCYNTHIHPYRHCFRRSHRECSSVCLSQFIHIISNSTLKSHQNQCHYIRSYPYVYCGQHSLHNCDSCYVCNGQYNPKLCFHQDGCSDACKQSMFSPAMPKETHQTIAHHQPKNYRIVHPGTPEYLHLMELVRQNCTLQSRIGMAYQRG